MEHELSRRRLLAGLAVLAGGAGSITSVAVARPGETRDMTTANSNVILYIHGLANKPPRPTKEQWWAAALAEGLRRNHEEAVQAQLALAYWADLRYPQPDDVQAMEERYEPAAGQGPLQRYVPRFTDRVREVADKWGGRMLDKEKDLIGLGSNVEHLLGIGLSDLAAYYDDASLRGQIRLRLSELFDRHRGKQIFLIAHSMGSIVAYDVLRMSERTPAIQVEHLVTIGSPLGLPLVSRKIRLEFGATQTPANVRRWTNLADPGDKVALDCNLANEYTATNSGVRVQDVLIHNDYVSHLGRANKHKSYGYLRAPELSDLVREFLAVNTTGVLQRGGRLAGPRPSRDQHG